MQTTSGVSSRIGQEIWLCLSLLMIMPAGAASMRPVPGMATARISSLARLRADKLAIRRLISEYVQSVDAASPKLAARVWWNSPRVSFINPMVWVHGFAAIQRQVYAQAMGRTFLRRDLVVRHVSIHVRGGEAWAEFSWTFHGRYRHGAQTVTSRGIETQVYWKIAGRWRLVHVHYSALPDKTSQ